MCNLESSRSHGVFCVRVISAEPTPWGGEVTRDGRLSLVDLSGSENIKRSGAVGARAKEAAAIGQVKYHSAKCMRSVPVLCSTVHVIVICEVEAARIPRRHSPVHTSASTFGLVK